MRSALDICGEVSGIYVCNGGDKCRTKERKKPFAPWNCFLGEHLLGRRNRAGVKSARFVFGAVFQHAGSFQWQIYDELLP